MASFKISYKKHGDGLCVKNVKIKKPCIVEIPTMVKDRFVTRIGSHALGSELLEYVLPVKNERLPNGCGVDGAAVLLPESIKYIERGAFECGGVKKVVLPSSVEELDDDAFSECKALGSVVLNDGLKVIGFAAFEFTRIKEIDIPKSVEEVGYMAFSNCAELDKITVADDNGVYRVDGNCLIENKSGTIIASANGFEIPTDESVSVIDGTAFNARSATKLEIPSNIKKIGDNAFGSCDKLTSVVVRGATFIDDFAFSNCTALRKVALPACLDSLGFTVFEGCDALELIYYEGTCAQWKKLAGDITLSSSDEKIKVLCSDGVYKSE